MKKICILSCGGTIAMKRNNKGNLAPFYTGEQLLKKLPELSQIANITVKNILNIDSTNVTPYIWEELITVIKKTMESFDGIVITHGTDTMAYTASALSFAIPNSTLPIVFTGSQKPLDDVTSDGRNNLINSLLVATMGIKEICIVFGSRILKGVRSTKVSESSLDAFDSPMETALGEISIEPRLNTVPSRKQIVKNTKPNEKFDANVLSLTLTPGLSKSIIESILHSDCHGIIIKAYGAGNIPSDLLGALKTAQKSNVPVVILSQCTKGVTRMQMYEVGNQALEVGAIPGGDMTLEAATTKLMWVLAQTRDMQKIKNYFTKSLVGEMTQIH